MEQTRDYMYDVAIIGAGPAGSIFAKEIAEARPDLKIAIIDGQSPSSAKPCGGLLAPDAQKLLARFDLVLPKSVLEDPQIFAVETIDINQGLVRYYQRHYLNMNRYAFDRWLISLIPSRVTLYTGRCIGVDKVDDIYNISLKCDGKDVRISSQSIVGADGGGSIVRRSFFHPMRVQYVAIQQWFEGNGKKLPYYSCIFDSKTSDSCSWTIHKENKIIFGGAFRPQGCRQAFDTQKSRLETFLGNSFGEAIRTEACLVSSPRRLKDFCTGKEGVFLLGEAAGFISSSSFEGLSSAMYSGKMLADSFAEGKTLKGVQRAYKKRTKNLRLKLRIKAIKRFILCSPILRRIIMKSGIQSIELYKKRK